MNKNLLLCLLCVLTASCLFLGCGEKADKQSAGEQASSVTESTGTESSFQEHSDEESGESSYTEVLESSSKESDESSYTETLDSASEESATTPPKESNEEISDSAEAESSEAPPAESSEDEEQQTPPSSMEKDDLATSGHVSSLAPQNYGTNNVQTVQSEVISENSEKALKGVFNIQNAPVYNGYQIWTWAEFRLAEHFGEAQNLNDKAFSYDVKTENCGNISSVILVSPEGNRTEEVSFDISKASAEKTATACKSLGNGWYRITIDFYETFFKDPVMDAVSEILIMFSNVGCVPDRDSVFYIDNAKIINFSSSADTSDVVVNNPDGYYGKTQALQIKIAGNSFVSPATSNSAYYLQQLSNAMGANVSVSYVSIGNGRIPQQYEEAFGTYGYMNTEHVDVLFIQDFYAVSDVTALGDFLKKLYEVSPTTELKIYAGENETVDGMRAASYYGVDHVDWRNAIKTLKGDYGFTAANLNTADGWHPNELSGLVGAIMMYAELYGAMPDFEVVTATASEVWSYIPGVDDMEKQANLGNIYSLAKKLVLNQ